MDQLVNHSADGELRNSRSGRNRDGGSQPNWCQNANIPPSNPRIIRLTNVRAAYYWVSKGIINNEL